MAKWDPDKALRPYEPASAPGTTWMRVLMDVVLAKKEGLRIPNGHDRESIMVWSLAIGLVAEPKHFVYGLTMRECFLRLRTQVKSKKVEFNPQLFPMLGRKPKKREKPKKVKP